MTTPELRIAFRHKIIDFIMDDLTDYGRWDGDDPEIFGYNNDNVDMMMEDIHNLAREWYERLIREKN